MSMANRPMNDAWEEVWTEREMKTSHVFIRKDQHSPCGHDYFLPIPRVSNCGPRRRYSHQLLWNLTLTQGCDITISNVWNAMVRSLERWNKSIKLLPFPSCIFTIHKTQWDERAVKGRVKFLLSRKNGNVTTTLAFTYTRWRDDESVAGE